MDPVLNPPATCFVPLAARAGTFSPGPQVFLENPLAGGEKKERRQLWHFIGG